MNRLELLASLLKGHETVADIGCDHAFVSIEAILKYNVRKVYACDINQGPLDNALKNITKHQLNDKITCVLSDGLKELDNDVEAVLISGMGGILISKILKDSLDKAKKANKLILQANSEIDYLRKFLVENNFHITNEHAIHDKNKYYEIIECHYNPENYSLNDLEIIFGPMLLKNQNNAFKSHYESLKGHLGSQLSKIKDEKTYKQLENRIKNINEILKF